MIQSEQELRDELVKFAIQTIMDAMEAKPNSKGTTTATWPWMNVDTAERLLNRAEWVGIIEALPKFDWLHPKDQK